MRVLYSLNKQNIVVKVLFGCKLYFYMKHKRRFTLIILFATIVCAFFLVRTTHLTEKFDSMVHQEQGEILEITPLDTDETGPEAPVESSEITEAEEAPATVVPVTAPVEKPITKTSCYVDGCSSHVCSSSPDVMTTCEWKEEYACYQKATCEVQLSGECGWTETTELKSCLATSNEEAY